MTPSHRELSSSKRSSNRRSLSLSGSALSKSQMQEIESYQSPDLARDIASSVSHPWKVCSTMHSSGPHRSIIPPATICLEPDSELWMIVMNHIYSTFASS